MTQSPPQQYHGIQALRFVAALLVVLTHSTLYVSERLVKGFGVWSNGSSGVDIFFVISGFVMIMSSRGLMGRDDGARVFLVRRLVRIVPLYWLVTTIKLGFLLAVPAVVMNSGVDPLHILKSYLFLPSFDANGDLAPIVAVGWTLNFEMFFYVVFALGMALRQPPVRFVAPVFIVLSILAIMRQPDWPAYAFWCDTIVLEFLAGMLIAQACAKGMRLPPAVSVLMVVIGFAALLQNWGFFPQMMRVVVYGIPAMLIVSGVAFLERTLHERLPSQLGALGDSSYALYLFHPMLAPLAPVVLAKLGLPLPWLSILLSIALAVIPSLLIYRYLERPVTAWLKRAAEPRRMVAGERRPA